RSLTAAMGLLLLFNGLPTGPAAADASGGVFLSDVVFWGLCVPGELKPEGYPEPGAACVRNYLAVAGRSSFFKAMKRPSNAEEAVPERRRNLAEQMVVILGEGVREEAQAFASAVPLTAEWEGMSEGPVDEANFVDNWLEKRPGTSIAPFLYLFKAHRLRAGYEAAKAGHEKGLWPILAERYRESLDRALAFKNPLISCVAADLEARAYVYLDGQGRP
ncbi:MAG: hypothetical protein ACOZBW_06180, partial [Thermodesulfobacteriota bacterium]